MAAQEQLCVVEGVEVVQGAGRAEPDALDLLEVDEERLLLGGRTPAELEALPGVLDRVPQAPREQGGHHGGVNRVQARLGGELGDTAAVDQHHCLTVVNVDLRAVGDDVIGALAVTRAPVARAQPPALAEDDPLAHLLRLDRVEPLVTEVAADRARRRQDKSH